MTIEQGARPTRAGLQPAVIEATLGRLAGCAAPSAARAGARIGEVLAPVAASVWPEVAWRSSRLTNTGMPLEFAWTSRDEGGGAVAIRWTAEVAPPETPDHERLGIAARLAFTDGPDAVCLARIREVQAPLRLRFGAWLGVRHKDGGDEAKVYAELPPVPAAEAATALGVGPHAALRTVGLTARMAGVFADGSVEIYARSMDLDEQALRGLERSAFDRDDRLWPGVVDLLGIPRLPRPCGVSIVLDPEGSPVALTWFTFAKAVFGSDDATVAGLASRTSSMAARRSLWALAGGDPDGRWRCGLVGVGVTGRGEPWLQLGMRPG